MRSKYITFNEFFNLLKRKFPEARKREAMRMVQCLPKMVEPYPDNINRTRYKYELKSAKVIIENKKELPIYVSEGKVV